ncbi:MAG: hypothetical protein KC964_26435 [Candidatus Omnitrophica bacterium]|nr:hypothetical protein [Candidatus Omnitrophota bacterium]
MSPLLIRLVCRFILSVSIVVLLSTLDSASAQLVGLTTDELRSDQQMVIDAITTGDPATALVVSGSALYLWKNHPDFLYLAESVSNAFGFLRPEEVENRFAGLNYDATGTFHGLRWLLVGLLARSVDEHLEAANCFDKIRFNGEMTDTPYPLVLQAESLLAKGRLFEATPYYDAAIELATGDPHNLFRVRYEYAIGLLKAGFLDHALGRVGASMNSNYPLEQLWIREELIHYLWAIGDMEGVHHLFSEMEDLISEATPMAECDFESRRMNRVNEVYKRMSRIFDEEDPVARMTMDEEATVTDFKRGNFANAVARLEPWILMFPLEQYSTWEDEELKEQAVWAHYVYGCALCEMGDPASAVSGFDQIITHVPMIDNATAVVRAMGWEGVALKKEGRLQDAIQTIEQALSIDADYSDAADLGLPLEPDQPSIRGGKINTPLRSAFVRIYKDAIREESQSQGGSGQ